MGIRRRLVDRCVAIEERRDTDRVSALGQNWGRGRGSHCSKDKKIVLDYPIDDEVVYCAPMANGNTLVTSYNRKNKVGQVVAVEVTPRMKPVRQWNAAAKSKGAHSVRARFRENVE
ncbi:MAG: hypothetical protein QGG42_03040 [Phycisphaerae bacterium]|jgi:hypothetical protein|nr:hypothetical protein [Phycisphaerae bacterium]